MTKILLFICLLFGLSMQAQQHQYSWKIGLHGGLSHCYGDISDRLWDIPQHFNEPLNDFNFLTYGLSIEHHLTRTFALRLTALKSQFKTHDRRYKDNKNYDRALNVQTDIIDGSLVGVFYFDNGKFFRERAFISPYVLLGGGLMHFTPKADLLNKDGKRYYYWADNTIRDLDPNDPNASSANVLERDYVYETDLTSLKTEGKTYSQWTWAAVFGIGFKIRVTKRIHIHGEALLRYTGTDYLDDVSGDYPTNYDNSFQKYASNPSNQPRSKRGSTAHNDWFGQGLISLHYSFGQKTHAIRPSMIYTPNVGEVNYNIVKEETDEKTTKNATTKTVPVRVNKVDTQHIVKVTKVTTTIITETTIDSSATVDSNTTNIKRNVPIENIDQSLLLPKERPAYLPSELDSAFQSNLLLNVKEEVIDSLFESQYQRTNPAPSWLAYSINKDSSTIPTEIPPLQQVTTPVVEDSVKDCEQIHLPIITTSDSVGTATVPTLSPDSLRLLQEYHTQMEIERQRFKNDLKEQQIRYQYELQLQQLKNQLEQERLKTANIPTPASPETYPNTTTVIPVPNVATTPPSTQALQEQLAQQQKELERLRQENRKNNSTTITPTAPNSNNQEQLNEINNTLQRQQKELERLRRENRKNNSTTITTTTPNSNNQEQLNEINNTLQRQQKELERLRRENRKNNSTTITTTTPNSDNQEQLNEINNTLKRQQKELERLRRENRKNNSTTITPTAPNSDNQEQLNTLNSTLQRQQEEIATLRQQLQKQKLEPTTPVVISVPSSSTDKADREALEQLMERETALRLRLEALEAARLKTTSNTPDTVRIIEQVSDPNSLTQQQLIEDLRKQLQNIKREREVISGTLQEFLNKKNPSYITKIYFDKASSRLTLQAQENLTSLVAYLQNYPKIIFWVKGYASPTGSKAINDRLSKERAAAVYNYLRSQGVATERLQQTAHGERGSGVRNELDRRAEIHLSFSE